MDREVQIIVIKRALEKFETQKKLADTIDSSQIQVSRYATGKRDIPLSLFLRILKNIGGKIRLPSRSKKGFKR